MSTPLPTPSPTCRRTAPDELLQETLGTRNQRESKPGSAQQVNRKFKRQAADHVVEGVGQPDQA